MDEDYLLATVRYVERNPVAAGLCETPEQWRWSSARAQLSGRDDDLVQVKPMLERVDNWKAYLSNTEDAGATDTIRRHTRTGRPLGSSNFIDKLELLTGKPIAPRRPGPRPSSSN